MTKYKFADIKRIEDDEQFFQHASTTKTKCVDIPSHLCFEEEEAIRWRAMQFQWHAREYIVTFAKLRETILSVRDHLKQYMDSRKTTIASADLGDAGTNSRPLYRSVWLCTSADAANLTCGLGCLCVLSSVTVQ